MKRVVRWVVGVILPAFVVAEGWAQKSAAPAIEFPFKENDRVAWVGSSSTNIGIWPKTMQFLLYTRHPELKLTFGKFTSGGGTFATGLQKMDDWLTPFKPSVVFFNYGGNDAGGGEKGLPQFKANMEKSLDKAKGQGARVLFMTPQAADVRKSGEAPAARRALYAEAMLTFAREKGWPIIDTHHPLADLQRNGQKDDDAYTILTDTIHLNPPGYIAWGYYLYEQLSPPSRESSAELTAQGQVTAAKRCKIDDIKAGKDSLSFTRADEVLPILPAQKLPPRKYVPLEKLSPYLLKVTGLGEGNYLLTSEGKTLGEASAKSLAEGINLNTLILDANSKAPWESLAREIWEGKGLDRVGQTRWTFEVRKKS